MGLALVKETITSAAPKSLALSIKYLWDGIMGLGNWMGYALAAGYYIGLDYNLGNQICEAFGYGYYVIDGLHYLISFSKANAASGDAKGKEGAATTAADAAKPAVKDV